MAQSKALSTDAWRQSRGIVSLSAVERHWVHRRVGGSNRCTSVRISLERKYSSEQKPRHFFLCALGGERWSVGYVLWHVLWAAFFGLVMPGYLMWC